MLSEAFVYLVFDIFAFVVSSVLSEGIFGGLVYISQQGFFNPILWTHTLLLNWGYLEVFESWTEIVKKALNLLTLLQFIENIIRPRRSIDNLGSIEIAIIEGKWLEMKVLLVLGNIVKQNILEGVGDDEAILWVVFRLVFIIDAAVMAKSQTIGVVVNYKAF